MIHTVKIPDYVSRLGCTPGGSCCSECKAKRTGPPIGAAATHVHQLAGTGRSGGRRNAALQARLGSEPDIVSTIIGYQDLPDDPGLGDALAAWAADIEGGISNAGLNQLIAAQQSSVATTAAAAGKSSISPAWIYAGVGLLAVLLLEGGSRSKR